jgi:hypothetical protein
MTDAQLESWAAESESVEEFLAGATAWRADPGRRDDGLQDLARRMIYRVMKTASFDMTAQTFGQWSGVRVFSLLQDRIKFTYFCQQRGQLGEAMAKEIGHYASLAVLSAHPGFTAVSGGITSPFWAWFDEPLNLNQPIRANCSVLYNHHARCNTKPMTDSCTACAVTSVSNNTKSSTCISTYCRCNSS